MRLIHSSDLQIGKVFMYFEPEVAALLQDARQAAVRTLGDLSGGQIVGDLLRRSLGLPEEALSFYRFSAIADIAAYKTDYRQALDAAGAEIADPAAVVAEAALAFRLNIALSEAVAALVDRI